MTTIPPALPGRLVLLIEEDPFLADYIGRGLGDAGAHVLGPARTPGEAVTLLGNLRERPTAAVVSIALFDDADVCDALERLDRPILLIRKADRSPIGRSARHDSLTSPFAAHQIVTHIRRLFEAPEDAQSVA
ncbi:MULTISPECIES: hypothetical protein [Bacteria]|uniref:hypothetical protein n=1 Tax=Bacteria TaxID=2 RepID=UPI0010573B07|nr:MULTISPECIES: hypothetical protein [Bacteria]